VRDRRQQPPRAARRLRECRSLILDRTFSAEPVSLLSARAERRLFLLAGGRLEMLGGAQDCRFGVVEVWSSGRVGVGTSCDWIASNEP
jgi:hypothetical protein